MPNIPTVVFTKNLKELIPAPFKSPWRRLFGTVTKFVRLPKALPVPFLIGEGICLYPLAKGSKIALSKAWLKANTPLFTFSKQSYTDPGLFFLDNEFDFYFFLNDL